MYPGLRQPIHTRADDRHGYAISALAYATLGSASTCSLALPLTPDGRRTHRSLPVSCRRLIPSPAAAVAPLSYVDDARAALPEGLQEEEVVNGRRLGNPGSSGIKSSSVVSSAKLLPTPSAHIDEVIARAHRTYGTTYRLPRSGVNT